MSGRIPVDTGGRIPVDTGGRTVYHTPSVVELLISCLQFIQVYAIVIKWKIVNKFEQKAV